jgi:hypothetical protein
LPDEAATWRQDKPEWSSSDEWAAKTIESVEHWGALMFLALTYGKVKPSSPYRLFEHPDRPGLTHFQGTGDSGDGPLSVAEFEKKIKKEGGET